MSSGVSDAPATAEGERGSSAGCPAVVRVLEPAGARPGEGRFRTGSGSRTCRFAPRAV